MRILCIADAYPWPETDGYRQRVANVARGLSDAGEVDLFAVTEREEVDPGPVADPPVTRAYISPRPPLRKGPAQSLRWLGSSLPRAVLWHSWRRAGEDLRAWADDAYDLVWYNHLDSYLTLGGAVRGPEVVDLDNLENLKARAQRRLRRTMHSGGPSARVLAGQAADLVDEWRWARLQQKAAQRAARVVVCSELDRQRLGVDEASIVPNGYRREGSPVGGRASNPEHPVLTMVGLMTYPPNVDAALHFAHQVMPLVRQGAPGAQLRIVGRAGGEVQSLAGVAGVVVCGEVPDIGEELARTDVAVVPIRYGGGTRIKILEAFAHHLPVVSTTAGAEGIDVTDGVHLLLADGARPLADACLRVVRDHALRQRLVQAAARLHEERYDWEVIRPQVAAMATEVAHGSRPVGRP